MIDAVKDYYKHLKPNERKRLLMRMGISLQTLYRRTADNITAYEIRALIASGMSEKTLYEALRL